MKDWFDWLLMAVGSSVAVGGVFYQIGRLTERRVTRQVYRRLHEEIARLETRIAWQQVREDRIVAQIKKAKEN